ncbi:APC family permease [Cryptosporangium minutisporangium]|uniref:APC family permease n=1 Tax=Cryptosporangium minutisporangium TaxID=113569 RepID=UPI0035ED1790
MSSHAHPSAGGTPGPSAPTRTTLAVPQRKRGLPPTIAMAFMGAVATGPLAVVTGGVSTIVGTTGVIGLGLIYALVAAALIAFSLASSAVVGHTGIAAGLHTYVARGLGERVGLGVAVLMAVSYTALSAGYYGIIGFEIANQIEENSGRTVPWVMLVVPALVLVGFLGTRSLRTNAIIGTAVLGVLIAAHFLFDLTAVRFPASGGFTAETLDPVTLFTGAVAAAVGFSVTAYPGIETPMAYGGELGATSRQVTNATYIAVVIAGLANVLAAVTVTSALGPQTLADGALTKGSQPVFDFLTVHLGEGAAGLFGLANLVAVFGASLIFHHAASRSIRSLAAAGVLPAGLAKRSARSGAPVTASYLQTGIAAVVLLAFAVAGADPFRTVFIMLSHIGSVGVFLSLVAAAGAVMVFLLRSDSEEGGFLGWEGRLVAAIVAALCVGAVVVSALLETHVRLDVAGSSLVVWVPSVVVIAALLTGVLWPARRRTARSLALDEEDEYATPVSASPALAHLIPGQRTPVDGTPYGPAPTGSYATPPTYRPASAPGGAPSSSPRSGTAQPPIPPRPSQPSAVPAQPGGAPPWGS